ncbi:MAG: hypothetical protein J6C50_01990 [Rickettsiales bacterium]|nr:hypothetical protein [Rickettsiales bacterium]
MTGIFEVEEGRNNNIKHVDVLQKVSRADGDRPEEGSMVAKNTKGINVILDYLTDLTLHVEATKKVFDSMVLYDGEQKIEQERQKLEEIKQKQQKQESREETNEVQTPEKVNKNTEQVNVTFVKKIDSSNKKNSTQSFSR